MVAVCRQKGISVLKRNAHLRITFAVVVLCGDADEVGISVDGVNGLFVFGGGHFCVSLSSTYRIEKNFK